MRVGVCQSWGLHVVFMWRSTVGLFICWLTEHDTETRTTWLDCGYERWAECRRCGTVWPP